MELPLHGEDINQNLGEAQMDLVYEGSSNSGMQEGRILLHKNIFELRINVKMEEKE